MGYEVFTWDNGATTESLGTPYSGTWIEGSDPVLCKTATIRGGSSLANAIHITLFAPVAARPTPFGKYGYLHYDSRGYVGVTGVGEGATWSHAIPIPNNPSLKGVEVALQTLSFTANQFASTLQLSNGLHWAVGY